MGDGNEPTGAEHTNAEPRNPDEGMFCPAYVPAVFYEVDRDGADVELIFYSTRSGYRVGSVTFDVIAAERVACEMIEAVRQIERIQEAQAGAS